MPSSPQRRGEAAFCRTSNLCLTICSQKAPSSFRPLEEPGLPLHQATYLATLYRIKGRSNWATNLTLFLEKGADPNWQGGKFLSTLII